MLLPVVQLTWNTTVLSVIGISPFYANYGFNPAIIFELRNLQALAERAKVKSENLRDLYRKLYKDL